MKNFHHIRLPICLGLALFLVACSNNESVDLEEYVETVLARPGGEIDPFPVLAEPESVRYSGKGRDPFIPFYISTDPPKVVDRKTGLNAEQVVEVFHRNLQELESYEIDSLRLSGIISDRRIDWGLIKAPNGLVHRVQTGDYLGKNFGKIVELDETEIEVRELVQGSNGIWYERNVKIPLSEG